MDSIKNKTEISVEIQKNLNGSFQNCYKNLSDRYNTAREREGFAADEESTNLDNQFKPAQYGIHVLELSNLIAMIESAGLDLQYQTDRQRLQFDYQQHHCHLYNW